MKKIISIICIVALLVTSIGMTFTNVAAAPVTAQGSDTVYWPTFTDDEGNAWYPYGPSDAPIPETVLYPGSATLVENTTGLPFTGLFEIPHQTDGAQINIEGASGNGIIFYVKAPETVDNAAFQLGMYLSVYNSTTEQTRYIARYNCNGVKYAAIGDGSWSSFSGGSAYSLTLNSGFEGYVYYPFSVPNYRPSAPAGDDAYDSATDTFTGIKFTKTDVIPEGDSLIVSAPIVVKGTTQDPDPSAEYVVVGGNKYYFDPTKNTVSGGTAPQNVNVGTVLLDAPLGAEGITSYRTYDDIASITPLTDSKSVKVQQHYNPTFADKGVTATFNYASTSGGTDSTTPNPFLRKGVMFYVDFTSCISDNTGLFIYAYFNSADNTSQGCYHTANTSPISSTRNFYYLADGSDSWSSGTIPASDVTDTTSGYAVLPDNFKGYVYIYEAMHAYASSAGRPYVTKIEVVTLGKTSSDYYYISAPIFVDSFDSTSTVVYYKNKAGLMDLATGEKYVEGYDEAATPFYGDETALYYDRDSVAQITPAAMATDTFYHADFGLSSSDTNFNIASELNASLVSSLSGAIKTPSLKFAPAETVASKQVIMKLGEAFGDDNALLFYIKNDSTETSYTYSTIRYPGSTGTLQPLYQRKVQTYNYDELSSAAKLISVDGTVYDECLVRPTDSGIDPEVIIPANFEGYMYLDLYVLYGGESAGLTEIIPAELYSYISLDAGEEFYMSLPLVVEGNLDYFNVSGTAFINDTVVPQNVKGNFTIPYDHNGDLKVNILDLVKADLKNTSDYALMRENYFDISVDSQAVASVFTER